MAERYRIFELQGTPSQNAHVKAAIDACDFPFERMIPAIQQQQGRDFIPVEWADLSRYAAQPFRGSGDHDHTHEEHDSLEGEWSHSDAAEGDDKAHGVAFRNRVLGLAWYSLKVSLDTSMEADPALAKEVFLSEGAHMIDFTVMTEAQRDTIFAIYHGGSTTEHGHDWFDVGGYYEWVGESFMGGFIKAYAPTIPVTIPFVHDTSEKIGAEIRAVLTPELVIVEEDPPDPFFRVSGSKVFHDLHLGVRSDQTFDTYEEAIAAGLRPCKVCRPRSSGPTPNIRVGVSGDLDFSNIPLAEPVDGDDDDLMPPANLLELYEVLEYQGVIRPVSEPRSADFRMAGMIGSSPFVSRAECGLRPPRSKTTLTGSRGNTGHWEGPRMGWPWDHSQCPAKIRGIQAYHMSKGWADLAYSSLECGHGYVFEARWFGIRTAANGTDIGNARHHAHCALIGEGDAVTLELKRAQRDVTMHFEILGSGTERKVHSDWKATACNGSMKSYWREGLPDPFPVPPPPPPTNDDLRSRVMNNPVLKKGATGHHVRIMQALLVAHATDLAMYFSGDDMDAWCDGVFGSNTEFVLATWQDRTGVLNQSERGICGPNTWAWLCGV